MCCHYVNKTVVVTNLQKIVLGRKIEQDLEKITYLHSKGKAWFSSVSSKQKLTHGSLENCSPYIRLLHDCSEAYTKMHNLSWLSLSQGSSDKICISLERGMYTVYGCRRGEREVAGTDVTCWCWLSREGDWDFCGWKSAWRIMLGQFPYKLFASLKSVKSCHVKDCICIVLSNTSIPHY